MREKKGQDFLLKSLTKVRENGSACLLVIGEVRTTQQAAIQLYAGQYPEDYKGLIVIGHLDEPENLPYICNGAIFSCSLPCGRECRMLCWKQWLVAAIL